MADWSHIPARDGPTQSDRIPAALREGFFRPDEMGFEHRLAIATEFAAKVPFYGIGNERDDSWTWADILMSDEACVMALILAKDTQLFREQFGAARSEGLEKALECAISAANTIDFWLAGLRRSSSQEASELGERIEILVRERLSPRLHDLAEVAAGLRSRAGEGAAGDDTALPPELARLGDAWRAQRGGGGLLAGSDGVAERAVEQSFHAFSNGMVHLKTLTLPYLVDSLGRRSHDPSLALFFVFLRQLDHVRERLGEFARRHLEFYYGDVLGATAQPARPDGVLLAMRPASRSVRVPGGTELLSAPAGGGEPSVFTTDAELIAKPAEVASLHQLSLERDGMMSPEAELGYVARLRARSADPTRPVQADPGEIVSVFDVQGVPHPAADPGEAADNHTDLGLAIASPLLMLREGDRRITISLELATHPSVGSSATSFEKPARELSREDLGEALGRAFHHHILSGKTGVPVTLGGLDAVKRRFPERDDDVLAELATATPAGLFQKLLRRAFAIDLSTADGWLPVDDFTVSPGPGGPGSSTTGMTFVLSLGRSAPALAPPVAEVHGTRWRASSPMIRFTLRDSEGLCGYSLFSRVLLKRVKLDVHVEGLRSVLAYSSLGRLDTTKPFQPFGPMPTRGTHLVVGSYEMARKRLQKVWLDLEWADLPSVFGGLETHYHGYRGRSGRANEEPIRTEDFRVEVSALAHGDWLPLDRASGGAARLFAQCGPTDRLDPRHRLEITVPPEFRPIDEGIPETDFDALRDPRTGFFRVSLSQPDGAFGHREYPLLLARSLAKNLRAKLPEPAPNEPYTPTLESLRLSYSATAECRLGGARSGQRDGEVILHFTPFGAREIHPSDTREERSLIPVFPEDHNLFIGLRDEGEGGRVSLLFELIARADQRIAAKPARLQWHYLRATGWHRLSNARILADSTDNFSCSGIVSISLPDDMDRESRQMPSGMAWLRVGTDGPLSAFPRFAAVVANGVRATRVLESGDAGRAAERISAGTAWGFRSLIPGIKSISQPAASFGGRRAEGADETRARISERVRHKGRAVSPWDYERLILEEFPSVSKVKCFPSTLAESREPAPGHVLVAVVPHPRDPASPDYERPMFDGPELREMERAVARIAPRFVELEVRNPSYEQIQVRCKVKFGDGVESRHAAERLNRALGDHIRPWIPGGYSARFGWSIRCEEVEDFVRRQRDVAYVTDFSILQISASDDGYFELWDSAKPPSGSEADGAAGEECGVSTHEFITGGEVLPRVPWSIAVPMPHHFIESVDDEAEVPAEPTGIGELEIGGTFIIPEEPFPETAP